MLYRIIFFKKTLFYDSKEKVEIIASQQIDNIAYKTDQYKVFSSTFMVYVMNPSRQKLRVYYFSDFSTLYLLRRTISTGILSYSSPCQN